MNLLSSLLPLAVSKTDGKKKHVNLSSLLPFAMSKTDGKNM